MPEPPLAPFRRKLFELSARVEQLSTVVHMQDREIARLWVEVRTLSLQDGQSRKDSGDATP